MAPLCVSPVFASIFTRIPPQIDPHFRLNPTSQPGTAGGPILTQPGSANAGRWHDRHPWIFQISELADPLATSGTHALI
jgi:hypothetical protein